MFLYVLPPLYPFGGAPLLVFTCFAISFALSGIVVVLPLLTLTLYPYDYPNRCPAIEKRVNYPKLTFTSA